MQDEMSLGLPICDRLPVRQGEITFEVFIPANSRAEALRTLIKDQPSRIPVCIQVAKSGLIAHDGKRRSYKVGYTVGRFGAIEEEVVVE